MAAQTKSEFGTILAFFLDVEMVPTSAISLGLKNKTKNPEILCVVRTLWAKGTAIWKLEISEILENLASL